MAVSNTTRRKAGAAGAAIIAAAMIATPLISKWEGTVLDPYEDPLVPGLMTVCTGQTRVEMRHYTAAECRALLDKALATEYAPKVLACTPDIADRPQQFAAAISLTYNIGAGAYCRSTVARKFNAHDWRGGCDAIMAWRFAGGREIAGLKNRRAAERAMCLKGL